MNGQRSGESDSFRRVFDWSGQAPASKSIVNRLLILRTFQPDLRIGIAPGDAADGECDDIAAMRAAVRQFQSLMPNRREEKPCALDAGEAGTTFRFLAARVSREPGRWLLKGSPRLLERPHGGLIQALKALGVQTRFVDGRLEISSRSGWQDPGGPLAIDRSVSSQFASAVALAACGLPFSLRLAWRGEIVSDGYWEMTVELLRRCGVDIKADSKGAIIARDQRPREGLIEPEPDVSSAFSLAALGALGGRTRLENFPLTSLQPDFIFTEFLSRMGAAVHSQPEALVVEAPASGLTALAADLCDSPDLFPALAVCCAFAKGRSRLFGAPHLEHKESSRIRSTCRLLDLLGAKYLEIDGGLEIFEGDVRATDRLASGEVKEFDPDQDHRLAMAAGVANVALLARGQAEIKILNRDAVGKSFPGFWRDVAQGLERGAR